MTSVRYQYETLKPTVRLYDEAMFYLQCLALKMRMKEIFYLLFLLTSLWIKYVKKHLARTREARRKGVYIL